MSLLAVGALLEDTYPYEIIDGNLEDSPLEALDAAVRRAGPDVVLGMTVMPGPQLEQAIPLCKRLKERHPQLVIVWGGYFSTQHWDVGLNADYIDYIVRGHSEYVFLHLLAELEKGQAFDLGAIPGLAYRDEGGEPITNALAPIPHPSKLPKWNFERVETARYVRPTFLGSRTLGYHSSYGCPFFCNLCAVVNMVNGRWFPEPAKDVADIVHMYKDRWGVNAVEFYDNNFFTQQSRVAEFSERIMGLDVAWWGEGRIDTMQKYSHETWQAMADSGLRMVFMGAESGSDETLKRMDKGGQMSTEKTLEMARLMKSYGVVPEFSFVMGNPPDAEGDMRQTMEFIRKVKKINPATEIIMYLYTPVPLSGDLYDQAKADGFAFPETLEEWVSPEWLSFSQRRSTTMPWIKRTLQDQIHDFERVVNAYYPTSTNLRLSNTWRNVLRAASAWRYHLKFYHFPLELRALHKVVAYQRPETSGF
jgi:radical SAM superfamily enzyme YgiQ (UPF0313 family)